MDLAEEQGLTLVGFLRGPSMNVYTGADGVGLLISTAARRGPRGSCLRAMDGRVHGAGRRGTPAAEQVAVRMLADDRLPSACCGELIIEPMPGAFL